MVNYSQWNLYKNRKSVIFCQSTSSLPQKIHLNEINSQIQYPQAICNAKTTSTVLYANRSTCDVPVRMTKYILAGIFTIHDKPRCISLSSASSTEQCTLTSIYWGSGGPYSQQHQVVVITLLGFCMTNGRLRHLLFRIPSGRASSSVIGWKPLVIPRREKKGCWAFLANEGLCPTSCNPVIPQAAVVPSLLPHSLSL